MVRDKELYNILEVESNADEAHIKKAYTKLSKMWHPDKNPNNELEATKKFQEINKAKEILLDEEKRKIYDQIGMDIFKNGMESTDNDGHNPFSNFGNMFGGGFPFGMPGMPGMPGRGQQKKAPEDIIEKLDVTLEQIYNQENVQFAYKYKVSCVSCNGEGTKDGNTSTCSTCQGKGMRVNVVRMGNMIQQSVSPCAPCGGRGSFVNEGNKCVPCKGKTFIIKDKTISVPLKTGLSSGNKILLSGKGHQFKSMKTDLVLVINELSHKVFKRNDNDLFIDVELKLYQALFGFDKTFIHLDKRELHLSCPSNTEFNKIRKISGEGMKTIHSKTNGDLYIRFTIDLPNFISLPPDTQTQLKSILQLFDKAELAIELQIPTKTTLVKTILSDCKLDESININNIIYNLNNISNGMPNGHDDNSEGTSDNERRQTGPGECVQQ